MVRGPFGKLIASAGLILIAAAAAFSQSNALDGRIEGTISDATGAPVPDARILALNTQTGAERRAVTGDTGFYRMPQLSLGIWRVSVEADGFTRRVRLGITLSAGETATVNFQLDAGDVVASVTVPTDAPVADAGKTDLGRVMNSREVHSLPLPTRNPYNFLILQANVTGRPNRGFNYPQVNVNGFARRVNYLLDGNTNTRGDQAGARLITMSEVFVSEVQLVTNGFAPEFGNTTGIIMNMVTPAGTNDIRGSIGYMFRRPSFYARPFFFSAPELPKNSTNNIFATISGPFIRDRWQWYFGYENLDRDDSTRSRSQVLISEATKRALIEAGVSTSIFVPAIPSKEKATHLIFRTDLQLDSNNNLVVRFNRSTPRNENGIQGNLNTMERSIDIRQPDASLGLQLVSLRSKLLHEFRFQYVNWLSVTERNERSGSGPSIVIQSVANLGSPTFTGGPSRNVFHVQHNVTWMHGSHAVKFGGGAHFNSEKSLSDRFSPVYTFPNIDAYKRAKSGAEPYRYTQYVESFGDTSTALQTTYWHLYGQDDWKATRRLKLNYGLRYDLYVVPEADPASPFPASRRFNVPKSNFAPRVGLVHAIRQGSRPLVLRAGVGIYYEPPFSNMYDRALLHNGAPKFFSLRFCGTTTQACPFDPLAPGPAFPNTFSGLLPAGSSLPQQDVVTVAPDFANMYALHTNVQLEQALTDDLSVAVVYVHYEGRHIPVYRNINPINPVGSLADGRPVFNPTVSAATRLDPRFNIIQMAESAGVSQYDGLSVKLEQRQARGLQFAAFYTFSKATDDAPEQNVTYSIGDGAITSFHLSDPTNRRLDRGYSYGDQRHTFVMSLVGRPSFSVEDRLLRSLLNNNQLGIITTANSGERFTIAAGRRQVTGNLAPLDLNLDSLFFSDRPVGIARNSGKTPPQFTLDLRYSRFVNLTERFKLEAICEVQNLFNINTIVAYSNTLVDTDGSTGEMIGPLPDFKARGTSVSLESRQLQIGVKFIF